MPNYPYPDEFCTSHDRDPYCYPILTEHGLTMIAPVARAMCALVSEQSKSYAVNELLSERAASTDPLVHGLTVAQTHEFVDLAVHAYCPEYDSRP
jgi:hypothetical protein